MNYSTRIGADTLHRFVQTIFERLGCLPEDAKDATDVALSDRRTSADPPPPPID